MIFENHNSKGCNGQIEIYELIPAHSFVCIPDCLKNICSLFKNRAQVVFKPRIGFEKNVMAGIKFAQVFVGFNEMRSLFHGKIVKQLVQFVNLWNACSFDMQKAFQIQFTGESLLRQSWENRKASSCLLGISSKNKGTFPKPFSGEKNFLLNANRSHLAARFFILFCFGCSPVNFRFRNAHHSTCQGLHFLKRAWLCFGLRFHDERMPQ